MVHPGGRPTKYIDKYNHQAYKACLLGATDPDIAELLEVDLATINNWKIKHPKFFEAIKKGRVDADGDVARSLYNRAIGCVLPEEHIVVDEDGKRTIMKTKKHYPPDTAAAFIWLKNRKPKFWRDKVEVEQKVSEDIESVKGEIRDLIKRNGFDG